MADCFWHHQLSVTSDSTLDAEPELVAQVSTTLSSLPVSDFDSACSSCPELSALRSEIESGWPSSIQSVCDALIHITWSDMSSQSRIPMSLEAQDSLHHSPYVTHQGIVHTKQCLWYLYWWPKIDISQLTSQVQSCIASFSVSPMIKEPVLNLLICYMTTRNLALILLPSHWLLFQVALACLFTFCN